jgi:glycerophosphoryl diester phosphodiesterase
VGAGCSGVGRRCLVVVHDDYLARVSRRGLRVSEATWDEISALRLPDNEHIPRLEGFVELARQTGCGHYIEIKSEGAGPLAWRILQEAGFHIACLASFHVGWIAELREAGCEYPLSVLLPSGVDPPGYAVGLPVEILHLCWRGAAEDPHELLIDELIQRLCEHDHQIVIWHEDRAAVLDTAWSKPEPVPGVCSSRPELLRPYQPDPAHPVDVVCHRGANNIATEYTPEA